METLSTHEGRPLRQSSARLNWLSMDDATEPLVWDEFWRQTSDDAPRSP
jgi:hypothetical protein